MSLVVQGLRSDLPAFDIGLDIEEASFVLRFLWNGETESWSMSIFDDTGTTPLLGAVKLVANFPLFANAADRMPPGALVCVDTTGAKQDPGFADLGIRHALLYYSAAELGL